MSSFRKKNKSCLIFTLLLFGILNSMAAVASDQKKESNELLIQKLERRIESLERQQKTPHAKKQQAFQLKQASVDQERQKRLVKTQFWPKITTPIDNNGYLFTSQDGRSQLVFDALIQTDQAIFFNIRGLSINNGVDSRLIIKQSTVDRLWMRRVRPSFKGNIPYMDFFIVPDLGQGQVRLFDGFMDIHYFDWLELNAGKQKSLIAGLERIKEYKDSIFVEYAYTTTMAPNREIGLLFHGGFTAAGNVAAHRMGYDYYTRDWLNYQIGLFSGTADETDPGVDPVSPTAFNSEVATVHNKSVEARLFLNPFQGSHNFLEGLGVGVAAGVDSPRDEITLPAILSIGLNSIFSYINTAAANGTRHRIHPQAYWFLGPFGLISEWTNTVQSLSERIEPSAPGVLSQQVKQSNTAGLISLAYNLTGEHSTFNTYIDPNRPFTPFSKDSWGAFQLVGRFTWLNMDSNVFNGSKTLGDQTLYPFADPRTSVQKAKTWGIGLNWYLNSFFRISLEYDQSSFVGGCSTGAMSAAVTPGCLTAGSAATASTSQVANRPDEKVIFQRFEFKF